MRVGNMIAATIVAGAATCGVASAQTPGMYVLHSRAAGGCPALDWHVALDPTASGDNLSGVIGWDNMKHIARVSGVLNPNTRLFNMTATEVGGEGRTAKIDGQLRLDGWMTANVTGPEVNCTNVTVPYYVPPSGN
jgi:hypothetical protein